jgi:hypothetical protein
LPINVSNTSVAAEEAYDAKRERENVCAVQVPAEAMEAGFYLPIFLCASICAEG